MGYSDIKSGWQQWTEGDLREQVAAMQKPSYLTEAPRVATIKSVKAVGAVLERGGALSPQDTAILKNTFNHLVRSGVAFAENFSFDVVNLAQGRDYLIENEPADLHVFCYVYSPSPEAMRSTGSTLRQVNRMNAASLREAWDNKIPYPEAYFHRQSGKHYVRHAWAIAAARQQAKIIATFGGPHWEINTDYFRDARFVPLIHTDDEFSAGQTPVHQPYGFLMAKDFLMRHGPHFTADTLLARRAREKASSAPASPANTL